MMGIIRMMRFVKGFHFALPVPEWSEDPEIEYLKE